MENNYEIEMNNFSNNSETNKEWRENNMKIKFYSDEIKRLQERNKYCEKKHELERSLHSLKFQIFHAKDDKLYSDEIRNEILTEVPDEIKRIEAELQELG